MPKINTYPALNTIREADLVVIATPAGSARSDAPAGVFIVSFAKFKQLIGSGLTPGGAGHFGGRRSGGRH